MNYRNLIILKLLYNKIKSRLKIDYYINRRQFIKKNGRKYKKIAPFLNINGWLTIKEAITLYELALNYNKKDIDIVEIGSWQGKSSFLLAKGLINNPFANYIKLHCVDPFDCTGEKEAVSLYKNIETDILKNSHRSLYDKFIHTMTKHNILKIISVFKGLSDEFVKVYNGKINILFIDGNHNYHSVLNDFIFFSPLLVKGGQLVFHDVDFDPFASPSGNEEFLGPGLVIKNYIVNNDEWFNFRKIDNLFIAEKR